MASITFYGAVDGVTGSLYLLHTDTKTILLECGLYQGGREQEKVNSKPFPFDVGQLDAVILSHAHLDHSGRLPKLVAAGYRGPVYMTRPTCELLEVLLKDAALLQQRDVEWQNRRKRRAGMKEIKPLYSLEDVEATLSLCEGIRYGQSYEVTEGIDVCFRDAGHILGSAIVELYVKDAGVEKKLVFSGDLGNSSAALLRDPEVIEDADLLMMESTYGDRDHRPMQETLKEFEGIIAEASANGGNILIPSFAVGRTQEIIFRLGELYQQGKLQQQAVFLDSPMAIAVTEIYHRYQNVFSQEDSATLRAGKSGSLHSFLPALRYSRSTEESMALNRVEAGAIIIAGSGMCNGGRIRHHLKHNLWRNNAHVLIVGYQAMGTPGRALVDGAKKFPFNKEKIAVKAKIHTLGGFSAHASQTQLLDWCSHFSRKPVIQLVHGELQAKVMLRDKLAQLGWQVNLPAYADTINL